MAARVQRYCALPGCKEKVPRKGAFCCPEHQQLSKIPFHIRGGVGGTMYYASADSVRGYQWVIRPDDARVFKLEEWATPIAEAVGGKVERVTKV